MEIETLPGNYFSSYEDLDIHKLMLEDKPRTLAYKDAILNNRNYFQDKIVMDVGCGTGILSIFCAQAGAKKVYAVEASNLAVLAKDIVKENKFEDIIEVIHSKVEDVVLPNYTRVDVIVSEWMGFYLLHEGMLDSVLIAREKFLKEDGHMFPESAALYIAPCSVPSLYQKWHNIYGVSMTTFAKELRSSKGTKPEILTIQPEDLLGPEVILCWLDMKETSLEDLESFSIQHVVGADRCGKYQGLCMWFECIFPDSSDGKNRVVLNTGPKCPPTHWKQTVIVLPQEQEVDEGEPIAFQMDINRDQLNGRRYNLQMSMLDPEEIEHPQPCSCHMTKCILAKAFLQEHTEYFLQQKTKDRHPNILEDEPFDDDDDDDDE